MLPDAGLAGQFVAVTLAIWNPYVAERLLQGHWSLLVGYGCLPWVATTMLRLRTSAERHGPACARWCSGSRWPGLTPTGLMLAATVALACVFAPGAGRPRWRCASVSLGAAVLAALPWLTRGAGRRFVVADAGRGCRGVRGARRTRPRHAGSLASLGGIWNAEAVPASRTTLFAVVAAVVLLGIVAAGTAGGAAPPAGGAAAGPGGGRGGGARGDGDRSRVWRSSRRRCATLPGLGVLRDAQKWVALAVPGYALAGAAAVVTLRRRLPAAATALICCAALVATLPDLAWGVGGKVVRGAYPPGWAAAAAMINADPRPVAVLPVDSMRRFAWAGDAPVLDPLPRWVRADVLTTGDLTIGGRTVPGEGERARDVQRLLLSGADRDDLADAGVGWVVVESDGDTTSLGVCRWPTTTTTSRCTGWAATIRRRRGADSCSPRTWSGLRRCCGPGCRGARLGSGTVTIVRGSSGLNRPVSARRRR